MEQVLLNLVVNARDAMPSGGTVRFELHNVHQAGNAVPGAEPQPCVELVVSDTGVGMDRATMSRVFEPFFTTKQEEKGTGLGLVTVHDIIQQHHGTVEVTSTPGRGTTFRIVLPAADRRAEAADGPAIGAASVRGSENVLLVEDDDSVRRVVRAVLESLGYWVYVAANGRDALAVVRDRESRSDKIDLLLTDLVMPVMGGGELVAEMRSRYPATKVLVMSGYARGSQRYADSIDADGIDADTPFIQKPFTMSELARRIREVVAGPAPA